MATRAISSYSLLHPHTSAPVRSLVYPSQTRSRNYYDSAFLPSAIRVLGSKNNSVISPPSSLFIAIVDLFSQPRLAPSAGKRSAVVSVRAERMESRQVPLAFRAPAFELPEPLTGKTWTVDDFEDQQGLLVTFICNHCPFVVHLKESLASFAKEYQQKGLGVVAISSNSVDTHPEDGPTYMADDAKKYGYTFPYLYDETQEVAKAYGVVCTPDFFLFKKDGRKPFELVYHGRYDETRPRTGARPSGKELKAAADALLSAQPIKVDQKPSIGCSIKWHPGK